MADVRLEEGLDRAIAAFRSGGDEQAVRAQVALLAYEPEQVLTRLLERLDEADRGRPGGARPRDGRVDGATAEIVLEKVRDSDVAGLWSLAGGTYDRLVALLLAVLAALADHGGGRTREA